jgi:hypothetical protein
MKAFLLLFQKHLIRATAGLPAVTAHDSPEEISQAGLGQHEMKLISA